MTAPLEDVVIDLSRRDPDLVRLMEALSLAAYVEPALLRRARRVLLPSAGAELEGRFWFSPLAEHAGLDEVLISPEVAEVLHRGIRRDQARLEVAHALVSAAHRGLDPAIDLFEDLVWRHVSPRAAPADAAELLQIAVAMTEQPERAADLARWTLRYIPRLPRPLRESDPATALALLAADVLGVHAAVPASVPAGAARLVAGFTPPGRDRQQTVGAQLTSAGLLLSSPPGRGFHPVTLPDSPGGIIRISSPHGGLAKHVRIRPGEVTEVPFSQLAVVGPDGRPVAAMGFPGEIIGLAADPYLDFCAVVFADHTVRFGRLSGDPAHWQVLRYDARPEVAVSQEDGRIAVAHGRRLEVWRDGSREWVEDFEGDLTFPRFTEEALFVVMGHKLLHVNDAGSRTILAEPIRGLVVEHMGNLLVVHVGAEILALFTPEGGVYYRSGFGAAVGTGFLCDADAGLAAIRSDSSVVLVHLESDLADTVFLPAPVRAVALRDDGHPVVAVDGGYHLHVPDESPIPLDFQPAHLITAKYGTGRMLVAGSGGALEITGAAGGSAVVLTPEAVSEPVTAEAPDPDAMWFKKAVFYQVFVPSFADADGDGIGDLRGVVERLDYLEWLGVDCLVLSPVFASPARDGGYDTSDFLMVRPEFGGVNDVGELVDQAHRRGIRVVLDLVVSHTSDAHAWFQESRSDTGGPYGEFYVWSDDSSRYASAPVILIDSETSNWAFDEVRGQFYWHRFHAHEPELNYDNPAVGAAMLDVLRFWLDLGVDGFRLIGAPYLFEREGTDCAGLPETHEFLRECRRMVDSEYSGRILLAEANEWPSDVVEYFGDLPFGDECHMVFHLPLTPRIFMAVRRETRYPIAEILAQTPVIPDTCQWGIVLRNQDELTLEMVGDEERDYLYAEYAKDPRMRANVGIRRRLAPLLDNNRETLALFTALLLSLPGSPMLYYGDEIGMGDNIWLGGRDSVRTPMQWSSDRNGGFSTSARTTLPLVDDNTYGYRSVNVEVQLPDQASPLNRTRRMIDVRRQEPALAWGEYIELNNSNPAVLAYERRWTRPGGRQEAVICINNLSRYPQPVEIDLRSHQGAVPVELLGGVWFPEVGELPYMLTLGAHGFYWFRLRRPDADGESR